MKRINARLLAAVAATCLAGPSSLAVASAEAPASAEAAAAQPQSCARAPRAEVERRLKKVVVEHLGVNQGKVTDNAKFFDDLKADDLDEDELIMAFEEEFDIEIPDREAEKIVTVKDAVDVVLKLQCK